MSTKFTRFATLGCQKFAKSKRRRGHNSQTKRPIAKISPLLTLQLLILSTGACFKVISCKFKGIFKTLFFWFMATLEGWCGRIGSASRGKGGESRIFLAIKGNPDLPLLTAHLKQLEVIICNRGLSIINGKGAKLQFYTPQKGTSLL